MEKSRPSVLVYDIEIVNAIPDREGIKKEGVEYCEGWGDHAGMGISVIGAYDALEDRYRVFCEDNGNDFAAAPLVGRRPGAPSPWAEAGPRVDHALVDDWSAFLPSATFFRGSAAGYTCTSSRWK